MFVFNGSRTAPSKSYVLLFDQTTQKATLERMDSTYTFNLSTKNGNDVSSDYGKIYPKKAHKDSVHDREEGEVDLFGEEQGDSANAGTTPDASNPYDFRHFLNAVKNKKDTAEDRGYASSPDYRSNTATSTANTPVLPARRAVEPAAAKKRKAASVFTNKPAAKAAPRKPAAAAAAAAPSINLERRATDHSKPPARSKPSSTAPAPSSSSSKIKSTEFVQSSDDSDIDAEGDPDSSYPTPRHQNSNTRGPSPGHRRDDHSDAEGEEDEEDEEDASDDDTTHNNRGGDLEIEVPDARPSAHRSSSHLNVSHAHDPRRHRSPSNGPISLASAANSVEGTPRRGVQAEEIDFGDFGGEGEEDGDGEEDDDVDVERMDIGPPARGDGRKSGAAAGAGSGGSVAGQGAGAVPAAAEVDEDDPLYMEMMEGLADSSEESEEE